MRNLFLVGLLLAQFSMVFAEEPFVFQSVRSMGMGGILSQNPAMLTEIKQKVITSSISYQDFSMHITHPEFGSLDLYLSHIGYLISYAQPNLCLSFNHWQRGDKKTEYTGIDEEGNEIGRWKDLSYETSLLLGIGKQILSSLSIGTNIKYLRTDSDWEKVTKIFDHDQTASFDIGILFYPIPQIKVFSTFYNAFSSRIEYWIYVDGESGNIAQELPKNLSLGINFSPNNKTLLGIQISHLLEEKVECIPVDYQFKRTLNFGGEITLIPWFSLRAGLIRTTVPSYLTSNGELHYHYAERTIPTLGFGYRYKHIEIDFAGIFDNRKKDIEEFSTVSSVTSTFRYMLEASWRF